MLSPLEKLDPSGQLCTGQDQPPISTQPLSDPWPFPQPFGPSLSLQVGMYFSSDVVLQPGVLREEIFLSTTLLSTDFDFHPVTLTLLYSTPPPTFSFYQIPRDRILKRIERGAWQPLVMVQSLISAFPGQCPNASLNFVGLKRFLAK